MFSKGRRSGSKSDSKSNRHRSGTPASDGSAVTSTPSGHPSTSTGLTSPSDMVTDFEPTSPPNQHATGAFASTFDHYTQSAFGSPQFNPGQYVYAQTDPGQVYYATPSPEPAAYPSPDGSDDLAASMVVYPPGSPPSPPKSRYQPVPEGKKTKDETTKKGKKKGSRKEEPGVVEPGVVEPGVIVSWRDEPADMRLAHGGMASGYSTYQFNDSFGPVGVPGYQARSPYPLSISDADAYGTVSTAGPSNQDTHHYHHYQQGEEGWDMCNDAERF